MVGRPKFNPTSAQRRLIRRLARAGFSERDIARRVGVDRKTLRLSFGDQIANYRIEHRLKLIESLYEDAAFGRVPADNALLKILTRNDQANAEAKKPLPPPSGAGRNEGTSSTGEDHQ